MATMVVLLGDRNQEFCLRQGLVARLAGLGVTSLVLVRDDETVGVVLEGWLFDPDRSGRAAAEALAVHGSRRLHPVMQLAVSPAAQGGGRDVRESRAAGA